MRNCVLDCKNQRKLYPKVGKFFLYIKKAVAYIASGLNRNRKNDNEIITVFLYANMIYFEILTTGS